MPKHFRTSRAAGFLAVSGITAALLAGCTATPAATSTSPSSTISSVTSTTTSSAPSAAQFFGAQSKALDEKQPTAQVAFTKEGAGSGTIDVPALPAGKTRVGLVINCIEGADWKLAIFQKTAANAGAPCSEGITPIADFAIDSPKGVTKLKLSVTSSTKYWLTVYYV